jgi:NAD(P) transhydrogenase
MNYDFDLLAIGSGPAGQRAAVQTAKVGKRAAIIERQRGLGGECVYNGTIPSKTFREAVLWFVTAAGVDPRDPFHRPAPPTIAQLLARVDDVILQEAKVISNQLARNGVTMIPGSASFVDAHTVKIEGGDGPRSVTAETIVVAVGTKPAPPPGVPADGSIVLTSDDMLRLPSIPRTMTVVGGGVIGIEYASMFAALGTEVTVIEKRDRPLEFLDVEIVDELLHQLRNRNVTFRMGESVERLEIKPALTGTGSRATIHLESGKHIVAEMVLFSVGRQGATANLNLSAAGLSADERGRIKVDQSFRTAVPSIFAAGDVIGWPSLAATSSEQGRLAACCALNIACQPMLPHYPVGIYAIPEISMVGSTEQDLTAKKMPYEVGTARYREIARGQILRDDSGLFKMLFHQDTGKLLGVHAIGTGATELIHIGQAVLALGGGLDYFLQTVFNYPTLAECYKVAALDAAQKIYPSTSTP